MTKGGGGVWKPPKLADIICEQPFTSLPHWDAIIVDSPNTESNLFTLLDVFGKFREPSDENEYSKLY